MRTLLKKKSREKNGKVWKVDVNLLDGNQLKVFEKDKKENSPWHAKIENIDENGDLKSVIFQKEFSGILTETLEILHISPASD